MSRASWCKHYGYDHGERHPTCARGLDNAGSGKAACCMPDATRPRGLPSLKSEGPAPCPKRADYSAAEIERRTQALGARSAAILQVMAALPKTGDEGVLRCPLCHNTISWRRVGVGAVQRSRGLRLACATAGCLQAMS